MILAQLAPSAGVETLLFAPAASAHAQIDELCICNRGTPTDTFSVSISKNGAATAAADFFYYQCPLPGNSSFTVDLGLTLNPKDAIRVTSGSGNLSFNLLGSNT